MVGGVRSSKHVEGLAVDIVLDNSFKDLTRLWELARGLCLQVIFESTHIHLEDK